MTKQHSTRQHLGYYLTYADAREFVDHLKFRMELGEVETNPIQIRKRAGNFQVVKRVPITDKEKAA